MPRDKNRHREKRSISQSSDSSYERKRSSKHKRRSRSRGRSETLKKRSSSRSRYKKRSYSRSPSTRDRYESKSKRRSRSKSRSKKSRRRSLSRDRSLSRSSSRSRSKNIHKSRRRSRSRSRSSSVEIERPIINKNFNLDDTHVKIAKAIKAAEAAGVTMKKIPTYEVMKEVSVKEDMPTITDRNLLEEINSDSFIQKSFTSSKTKKKQNIVIDLNSDTIKVPVAEIPKDDSIINFSVIPSEEELRNMWVKKLYIYRKKMLKGEI